MWTWDYTTELFSNSLTGYTIFTFTLQNFLAAVVNQARSLVAPYRAILFQ